MTKEEHIQRLKDDPIYVVMGEALSLGRKNTEVAKTLLDVGVRIIQYREKHKTWREKYAEASEIAVMCKKYGATFIMNDSVDLAIACGADGIHVVTEETIRSALEFPLPVVTIGGIGLENIRTLYDRGFRSFAMISAVVSQKDIKKAVDDLRQALK